MIYICLKIYFLKSSDCYSDEGKIWIVQVANPAPAKRKIIIRVHEKIRESNDPIIGLGTLI